MGFAERQLVAPFPSVHNQRGISVVAPREGWVSVSGLCWQNLPEPLLMGRGTHGTPSPSSCHRGAGSAAQTPALGLFVGRGRVPAWGSWRWPGSSAVPAACPSCIAGIFWLEALPPRSRPGQHVWGQKCISKIPPRSLTVPAVRSSLALSVSSRLGRDFPHVNRKAAFPPRLSETRGLSSLDAKVW